MVAWLFLHMPPAPRNVSSPEAAESPAPHSAKMRFEDWSTVWNFGIELLGPEAVMEVEDIMNVSVSFGGLERMQVRGE